MKEKIKGKIKGTAWGIISSLAAVAVWVIISAAFGLLAGLAGVGLGILFLMSYRKNNPYDKSKYPYVFAGVLMLAEIALAELIVAAFLAAAGGAGLTGALTVPGAAVTLITDMITGTVLAYGAYAAYILVNRRKGRPDGADEPAADTAGKKKKIFLISAVRDKLSGAANIIKRGNYRVACSALIMGSGQLLYKQWAKGVLYLIIQLLAPAFFIWRGGAMIAGFFTLGTVEGNQWFGVEGDNSVAMLIMGIFAIIVLILYFALYTANIKDVYETQRRLGEGKAPAGFVQDVKELLDKKFHKTALFIPVIGVGVFNVLPIIFMILIAFTNYGGDIVPPALVDWSGLVSFEKIMSLGQFAPTFVKILGWNFVWAVLATALNYFGGLGLALLYNKKCVRGKAFWRAFPILAYAVPGFISLLAFKFMFSYGGPVNQMIIDSGKKAIGFLDLDAKWSARAIGLAVNAWISIPTSMLLATGILSNMNRDLYEAARIDGASPFRQFISLTLPFVLFATTPVLITSFIGNFNNFGIFYFLRGGLYMDGYFLASDTDLLINWLYNLSIDNNYYSIGAAISLVIFIITSLISLTVYIKSPSYKQEDTFR
ncbi:MAG: sugar ABC transporter permease [Clostridiales bacterium]|nr:sugar ABC transporter permease [Clostridiales bacterium]